MDIEFFSDDVKDIIKHGMYVSNMAYLIGKKLQLDENELHELAVAGVLHDIGKLRLSGYIYGDETDSVVEQMRYVRTHSALSYDIIHDKGYSEFVEQAVLHHHENYDGSGYPDNMRGEAIPYGARILRVCDVFIALISDRPYRKAFDVETAIELMIDEVKNFDMEIFLAFMSVVHEIDLDTDVKKIDTGMKGYSYGIN